MCNNDEFRSRLGDAARRARVKTDRGVGVTPDVLVVDLAPEPGCFLCAGRDWLRRLTSRTAKTPRAPRYALGLSSDENRVSVFLTSGQKDELLRLRGSLGYDWSKMIRTCIALGLPMLKEHPSLIGHISKNIR